jgi:hypothetical protein
MPCRKHLFLHWAYHGNLGQTPCQAYICCVKTNTLLIFLFLMIICSTGCKKFRMEKDVPACLEKTTEEKVKSVTNDFAVVLEYEFQGALVYVFDLDPGNADSRADIYNDQCQEIGYLGGQERNREVLGEDFASAKFKRQVWPTKK